MKKYMLSSLIATSILISVPTVAIDDEKTNPQIQHRQNIMEIVKYSLLGMSAIIKGEVKDQGQFPALASSMASATSVASKAFETDTRALEGKTTAKSEVWDNWQDFSKRMDTFNQAAQELAVVAKDGDMKKNVMAFKNMAKNCKSCHDEYREDT